MRLLLIDITNSETKPTQLPLEEAARELGLDPHDVEWSLGEFGRCDTGTYVVVNLDQE